jgi:hypothetical protein
VDVEDAMDANVVQEDQQVTVEGLIVGASCFFCTKPFGMLGMYKPTQIFVCSKCSPKMTIIVSNRKEHDLYEWKKVKTVKRRTNS